MLAYAKAITTESGQQPALPLADHGQDVAAVMAALLAEPTIRRRLAALAGQDRLAEAQLAKLCVLAGLHDAGKANRGFQARLAGQGGGTGHVGVLLHLLTQRSRLQGQALQALQARTVFWPTLEPTRFRRAALAIFAHHGRIPVLAEGKPDPELWVAKNGYEPLAQIERLVAALLDTFPQAQGNANGLDLPGAPRFWHAVNGLLTLADWLGSDTSWFALPESGEGAPTSPDRPAYARAQAEAMLAARHLAAGPRQAYLAQRPAGFDAWLPELARLGPPRWPQQALLDLGDAPAGGRTVVLEAETGSGKTEAALLHFFDLLRQGAVDGLYFALPTRAAAIQIQGRIARAVQALFGEAAPPVGLAVPGYEPSVAATPDPDAGAWPDDPRDSARERSWATARAKRYLAGPIMVGTVDQVLLGALKVSHNELRSACLLRQLVVVDEVHASDPYMRAILGQILDQHRAAGGHGLLMSATLGSSLRTRLLAGARAEPPAPAEAAAVSYPAVFTDCDGPNRPTASTTPTMAKDVAVTLVDAAGEGATDAVARHAVAAAAAGARVLVLRNTVPLAVATQAAVEAQADPAILLRAGERPAPHHSRYAPADRRFLDAALEAAFSPHGEAGGIVAVTTQTAEQSLDIDADLMITDIAPADVLLQRLGRLHRHTRDRPAGYERPQATVLAPSEGEMAGWLDGAGNVSGAAQAGLGRVYDDLLAVLATRRFLAERGRLAVPADNRPFVEAATHPGQRRALAEALGPPWPAHAGQSQGREAAQSHHAGRLAVDWTKAFDPHPGPADEAEIRTRLGADTLRVPLPEGTVGPFGLTIDSLPVPAWQLPDRAGEAATQPAEIGQGDDGNLTVTVAGTTFRYDRWGLRQKQE